MPNKKKYLLITSSYPAPSPTESDAGGVFVKHFASELAKTAKVIVLTQQTSNEPAADLYQTGLEIIRFPWRGVERPLSTLQLPKDIRLIASVIFSGFRAALKITKTFKPYHTLAVWALPSGVWALFLKWIHGTPYSTWSLGSDIWSYRQNFFTRNLLRLILHEADHRYADGYQLKADVAAIAKKPCDFLSTSRSLPIEAEAEADVKKNKRNYLFIGRYHSNKGPDVLLEAVNKLKPVSKKKVHFHLFGGGQLSAGLKNYIHKHGLGDTVTLNGYIDATGAAAYLKACDALIIPSRIESIPVVLSDALKAGSRIIATDVGDMGYLLRKYRAGVVVPSESPGKLAQAIEDDMSLPSDYFARGRKELLKMFDVSESVARFLTDNRTTDSQVATGCVFEK